MDYNPPYVKCFHGVYDARFCSICIGTATPDRVERFTDELVKDKPWSGHGVEQAESTASWNAAPVLQTSEEIWKAFISDPENDRLLDRVYKAYSAETAELNSEAEPRLAPIDPNVECVRDFNGMSSYSYENAKRDRE